MVSKLDFVPSGYAEDFFALVDIPKSWQMSTGYREVHELRFVAYDTSPCENERDAELHSRGIGFNCHVDAVSPEDGTANDVRIHCFVAVDRAAAEMMFSSLYEELLASKPDYIKEV